MEPFVLHKRENQPDLLYLEKWMKAYPALSAGFTSRIGGVSRGGRESLNCALHVGDLSQAVIDNRRKVADALGFSFEAWTCAEQVHGNEVMRVTLADRGKGRMSREDAFPSKDAMITNERDVLLTSFYADCVPLYFYDPIKQAVALAHAGWKGTVKRIAEETVAAMQGAYGSRPENIRAAIGPSIGGCCYEVDDFVISQVRAVLRNVDLNENHQLSGVYIERIKGKYRLDLKEMNRQFMIKAGILPTHIEISGLCTSCSTDLFFSHRKEHGKTGRMASWIALEAR